MHNKKALTGIAGEYFICSQILLQNKNCFITLGNAKSVDLILIDDNKKAHFIDVKSTSTLMKNSHHHTDYEESHGLIGRWQLPMAMFWQTHKNNENKSDYDYADYYIFHNTCDPYKNIIVISSELVTIMHRRIDDYLVKEQKKELEPKNLVAWDVCDYCFHEFREYNNWAKLP